MPLIGLLGGRNISEATLVLVPAVTNAEGEILESAVTLNYGAFLQSIIDFLIVALTIFLIIKTAISFRKRIDAFRKKRKKKKERRGAGTKAEELLMEIRDLLKKKTTRKKKSNGPFLLRKEEGVEETSSSSESAKTATATKEEGIKEHRITYRYRLCE